MIRTSSLEEIRVPNKSFRLSFIENISYTESILKSLR